MSHDAIVMLKEDHRRIRGLLREFRRSSTTATRKEMIVERLIELLTVHSHVENEVMYPRVRALVPELGHHVLESAEEHHLFALLLGELAGMTRADERFMAKAAVLVGLVRNHLQEEEDEWFPQVRARLSRPQLRQIGLELRTARMTAPRRPEGSATGPVLDTVPG